MKRYVYVEKGSNCCEDRRRFMKLYFQLDNFRKNFSKISKPNLRHFKFNDFFPCFLKARGFQMFSGGVVRNHEMGLKNIQML